MMASRFKLRLKRNKRRARAQSRTATAAQQPISIAAPPTGVQVLEGIDQHFKNIFGPKSLRDVLSSLASKS